MAKLDHVAIPVWGYGAEIADPDGPVLRIWDQKSMREKGW